MAEGNFAGQFNKGSVMPNATSFQRRTNHYNIPLQNNVVKPKEPERFTAIDGRKFTSRDQVFKANQEYYKKMTSQGNNFTN